MTVIAGDQKTLCIGSKLMACPQYLAILDDGWPESEGKTFIDIKF